MCIRDSTINYELQFVRTFYLRLFNSNFWSWQQPSEAIERLIKQENTTVEDLLAEEDFL